MKYLAFMTSIMGLTTLLQAQTMQNTNLSQLTSGFIKNQGQVIDQHGRENKRVAYLFSCDNFGVTLNTDGFSYQFFKLKKKNASVSESNLEPADIDEDDIEDYALTNDREIIASRIDVRFKGSNRNPEIIAENALPGVMNFYTSSAEKDAHLTIPRFQKVIYKNIYNKIDLEFLYNEQFTYSPLEYRFVIYPGGDPSQIRMVYEGADAVSLNNQGELNVGNSSGEITERGLMAFEANSDLKIPVSYQMAENGTIGFEILTSSKNTIIIDPEIVWGTYFGGKGSEDFDTESEIKIDHEGKVVICGSTTSISKIATTGAFQVNFMGIRDIILAKFNPDGSSLVFASYYGGSGKDVAYAIDLDNSNNIVVGALCGSQNMATAGSYKPVMTGLSDALIAKFTPAGQLVWATYLGGAPDDNLEHVRSVQVMPNNQFYITGFVSSDGSGTPGVYQPVAGGSGDAFVARFNADGFLIWFTYYGGSGKDRAHSLTVVDGYVYIIGTVKTKNGMATPGAFRTKGKGPNEVIFAKFDTSGHLVWGTYFGGDGSEHGRGVLVDHAGNVYITGWTDSFTGIATPGSYLQTKDSTVQNGHVNDDGFIAKFTPDGHLIWGTYIGGEATEYVFNLIRDNQDNFYLCGKTGSNFRIATNEAIQLTKGDLADGFIAKIDTGGNFLWGTYLGGEGIDQAYDMDLDSENNNLFIDISTSSTLATTSGAYKTTRAGGIDLAVFKITVPVTCSDNFEPNNTFSEAISINTINDSSSWTIGAKIDGPTDEDWYKVITTNDQANLNITLSGLSSTLNLQLFDGNENLIAETIDSGTSVRQLFYNATSGSNYYIYLVHDSVMNEFNGCYNLSVTKSGLPLHAMKESGVSNKQMTIQVFPNPANTMIILRAQITDPGLMEVSAIDFLGNQILRKPISVIAGISEWSINTSMLRPGIYQLICRMGDEKVYNSFVISR